MFIINLTKEELVYRAHGEVIKLKKGLNLLNNCITSAKELKDHFGNFVKFVNDEVIELIKEKKAKTEDKAEEVQVIIEDETPAELKTEEVAETEDDESEKKADVAESVEEPKEECDECKFQPEEKVEEKPAKKQTKRSTKKSTKR